jgi:NhaA family Na+:H+ antiporter
VSRAPAPAVARLLPSPLQRFLERESAGAVLLLGAAALALVWANVGGDHYEGFWSAHRWLLGDDIGSLRHAVDDGLMTFFFAAVALEIKRELVHGELRDRRTAAVPVVGAIGGMVLPALLYVALNLGGDGARGWAVPMATDVAFVVGVLALMTPWVSDQLKLFVLALAVVDDIGAIVVIALFFGGGISPFPLLGALGLLAVYAALQRGESTRGWLFVVLAVGTWVLLLKSGVHATMAGVGIGLLTRAHPAAGQDESPVERWERRLHPISSWLVIPLFGLANAGVAVSGDALGDASTSRVTLGIILGLVVGKTLGIVGAVWLAVRAGLGAPSAGHVVAPHRLAAAAGIGFTSRCSSPTWRFADERAAGATGHRRRVAARCDRRRRRPAAGRPRRGGTPAATTTPPTTTGPSRAAPTGDARRPRSVPSYRQRCRRATRGGGGWAREDPAGGRGRCGVRRPRDLRRAVRSSSRWWSGRRPRARGVGAARAAVTGSPGGARRGDSTAVASCANDHRST